MKNKIHRIKDESVKVALKEKHEINKRFIKNEVRKN